MGPHRLDDPPDRARRRRCRGRALQPVTVRVVHGAQQSRDQGFPQSGPDDRVVDEPVRLSSVGGQQPDKAQPTGARSARDVDGRSERQRRANRSVEQAGKFALQRRATDLHGQQPAAAVPSLQVVSPTG
ncbi:hypothetical protein Ato02nite_054520 [Paractinoplanes toevensis]|uniref:Uncharacterized protein n=1 Tax=Paractinoplanes toevensis TaxID=571911 RepID=A0A919TGG7_9ACTN|nr:hypothetical protein Ato02nite_054520 [Actinoplanes toevensis]